MSVYVATSPFFALNPEVWVEGAALLSRTNVVFRGLSLFSWERTVRVDRKEETITIRRRYLWMGLSERTLAFRDISHFDYRYESVATGWTRLGNDRTRVEWFSIEAVLHQGDPVVIERFRGECAMPTGVLEVLLGGGVLGARGTQEESSLSYLDLIQVLTDKGLSKGAKPAVHR